jgi:hypothetical protein
MRVRVYFMVVSEAVAHNLNRKQMILPASNSVIRIMNTVKGSYISKKLSEHSHRGSIQVNPMECSHKTSRFFT